MKVFLRDVFVGVVFLFFFYTFLFQPFAVPTPSMAGTLLPGDRIVASKLHYGPQTPRTLGIPFTDLYIKGLAVPNVRLPGFSQVRRGDVVVFHWPADEGPIDWREPYVKRAIGLPGDSLQLVDKAVLINGSPYPSPATLQQDWIVRLRPGAFLPPARVRDAGGGRVVPWTGPNEVLVTETPEGAIRTIETWPYVESVAPYVMSSAARDKTPLYPPDRGYNRDQYGPLLIPGAGTTVSLTDDTWEAYEPLITRYERHDAARTADGTFTIDGQPASEYTFAQDYFFMMGDNRDNSLDSRYWGLVPADHLIGKALFVLFSIDPDSWRPRLNRTLRGL